MDPIVPGAQPYDPMLGGTQTTIEPFKRSYLKPREGVALFNGTPAIAAIMQILDPMGMSSADYDRRDRMYGSLYKHLTQLYPEAARARMLDSAYERPDLRMAERNSLNEDLNSVMIKYDNWRAQQNGLDLTPQQRVTQGFIDVRNPNSWY